MSRVRRRQRRTSAQQACVVDEELVLDGIDTQGVDRVLAELEPHEEWLNPIVKYYIVDAVLSHTFDITTEEAVAGWKTYLREAQFIKEGIYHRHAKISETFRQAATGIHVLEYFMRRKTGAVVCGFQHTAINFIVSMLRSDMAICHSYTMFVHAIALQLKLYLLRPCHVPGHVFTIVNGDDSYALSFDAGFQDNDYMYIILHKTGQFSLEQVSEMLEVNTDPDFFRVKELSSLSRSKQRRKTKCESFAKAEYEGDDAMMLHLLIEPSKRKNRLLTTVRNLYLAYRLLNSSNVMKVFIQRLMFEKRIAYAWFEAVDSNTVVDPIIIEFEIAWRKLLHCKVPSQEAKNNEVDLRQTIADNIITTARVMRMLFQDELSAMEFAETNRRFFSSTFRFVFDRVLALLDHSNIVNWSVEGNPQSRFCSVRSIVQYKYTADLVTLQLEILPVQEIQTQSNLGEGTSVIFHPGVFRDSWSVKARELLHLEEQAAIPRGMIFVYRFIVQDEKVLQRQRPARSEPRYIYGNELFVTKGNSGPRTPLDEPRLPRRHAQYAPIRHFRSSPQFTDIAVPREKLQSERKFTPVNDDNEAIILDEPSSDLIAAWQEAEEEREKIRRERAGKETSGSSRSRSRSARRSSS